MACELHFSLNTVIQLEKEVYGCDFNAFNTLALGSADKSVYLWEWTQTGFKEASYSPLKGYHNSAVVDVRFSKDGLTLVSSSSDGKSLLFDIETGTKITCLTQSTGGNVRRNAISPNSSLFVTVTDHGYIFLWNMQTHQIYRFWRGHEACINGCTISPDSLLLATGDSEETFKLWLLDRAIGNNYTVDSLTLCIQKDCHSEGITTMEFSPKPNVTNSSNHRQYTMCTGGNDNQLRLWLITLPKSGVNIECIMKFEGHSSSITDLKFSLDGKLVGSTSLDGSARIWEVQSGSCFGVLCQHKKAMFCCSISPTTGFFVAGFHNKTAQVWRLTNGMVPVTSHLLVSIDERALHRPTEQTTFNETQTITYNSSVNSVDFNSKKDLVVGCGDKTVELYKFKGYAFSMVAKLFEHSYSVTHVEFSRSGLSFLSGSNDGCINLWNFPGEGGLALSHVFCIRDPLGDVSHFSPIPELIALGDNDGALYMYSTSSRSIVIKYEGHTEGIKCLAFTPDGEYFASGCVDGLVKIWKANPPVPKCQALIENVHDLGVMTCDFSQNYKIAPGTMKREYRLATGGQDNLIKIYKLEQEDEMSMKMLSFSVLVGHGGPITEVRFSNKTTDILASTSFDRTARIWNSITGQCLSILDKHKGVVNCCAFSPDAAFFVTGSLDKTIIIWRVPKIVIVDSSNIDVSESAAQPLPVETSNDVELDNLALDLDDLILGFNQNSNEIPDHLLCPITRQIMTDPVVCSDGFTYERSAIETWIATGRNSSPMTNVDFASTYLTPNIPLEKELKQFLLRNNSGNLWLLQTKL